MWQRRARRGKWKTVEQSGKNVGRPVRELKSAQGGGA